MISHILVVDDDADVRESFVLALDDTEYHVDTAESAEEGIKKEKNRKYDLIFLDLKMPGMSGVEALKIIRAENQITPICIITAFHKAFFEELESAAKEGFTNRRA